MSLEHMLRDEEELLRLFLQEAERQGELGMKWYTVQYSLQSDSVESIQVNECHVKAESASLAKKLVRAEIDHEKKEGLLAKETKLLMITARKDRRTL